MLNILCGNPLSIWHTPQCFVLYEKRMLSFTIERDQPRMPGLSPETKQERMNLSKPMSWSLSSDDPRTWLAMRPRRDSSTTKSFACMHR